MRFQLRIIPFIVTVMLCALGVSLALWQTHRAEQKEALALLADQQRRLLPLVLTSPIPKDIQLERREVALEGDFISEWPMYLDNRPHNGVAGFYVLMPFRLKGSDLHVMIVRGWQARNPNNRLTLPTLRTPSGTLQVLGVARHHLDKVLQLGAPEPYTKAAIIQNFDLQEIQRQSMMSFNVIGPNQL
jgi:surfeit locus 1 family protein